MDIGTGGEHYFMALCATQGITANKSQADKHGWDVLIEIDRDGTHLSQITLHEPVITGTVQIKSTTTRSLKVSVSLSNLRKMASSSLPAFYLLMDYSQGQAPTRAFLRHVDEDLIRQILERVNQHMVVGDASQLHKRTMQIDFALGQEIDLHEANALRTEFLRAIGNSQATYTERKQHFLRSVGYEDGVGKMRFQLVGLENVEAMIEATMGRGGTVEMQNMLFALQRFGLEDPQSHHHTLVGTLVVDPSPPMAVGTITLRSKRTGDNVQVPAAAYVSGMYGAVPSHVLQARIDCGLFDWYISADGASAKFKSTLDPENPVKLEDLHAYLQIVAMLHQPEGLGVEFEFGDGPRSTFTIKNGSSLPAYPRALELADSLLKIKTLFGDRGELNISLVDLLEGSDIILPLSAFLNHEASATLYWPAGDRTEAYEAVVVARLDLTVDGKYYLAIIAIPGEMTLLPDGRFSMSSKGFDTIYKTVLREDECRDAETLRHLQEVVDDYSHSLPVVRLASFI
ncbi:hypothetical protein V2K16_14420 [Pseudomonas alliivorans]|uniref:hypothetical protein n=1 Tax=Pseudomonas alliivorans TaxID=2810613 RepID=UPI001AE454D6|nr:hypothetical protein [Pseudomonas alliivorans]MBP0941010.1 hypothetical protein [Pseudomonas alliivorans]MEE4879980.1 hypothetical protein [Pseudomonas alliivorans]MEE4930872.1 hypothetical protein [Pseudomonas alliivorans]MEE4936146.1 hypothetical protein [Pseudomonas alliivorans]MEE4940702.1 hypothetical protein [Pseudomonas alliivorans]